MKTAKRWISFLLILAMLCTGFAVSAASNYDDVKTHWAKTQIEWATAQGLMNGTGNGKFSPNGSAERAMLVTILYRSAGKPAVSASTPFTDLKQSWYQESVAWAHQNGIVNGTGATTFSPTNKITRQDLATILYRYAKNTLQYNVTASGSLDAFPDAATVSSYAKEALLWANGVGLVNGELKNGVSYLNPKGNATRAQLAVIFYRFAAYQETMQPEEPASGMVVVPGFLGMSQEAAVAAAATAGLAATFMNTTAETYNTAYAENTVSNQSISVGAQVAPGTPIVLYLNVKPATTLTVPDLIGLTLTEAAAVAAEAGVTLAYNEGSDQDGAAIVTAQFPAPGPGRPLDTTVTLTARNIASFGNADRTVPDFIGLTQRQAIAAAAEAGFKVKIVESFELAAGYNAISAQSAEKGSILPAGTEIELTYNPDYTGSLKVASYNVKNFMGSTQFDDIAAEVLALDPDIIGFQEVDLYVNRSGKLDQMKEMAARTGYPYYYFGKSMDLQGGEYGHGFLSKYPIVNTETVSYTAQGNEVRSYDRCQIVVRGTLYTVYNTHLDLSKTVSAVQLKELLDRAAGDTFPIVLGDMNMKSQNVQSVMDATKFTSLNGGEDFTATVPTFPAGVGRSNDIDHIIVGKNLTHSTDSKTGAGLYVSVTDLSDHNMVYAFIKPKS